MEGKDQIAQLASQQAAILAQLNNLSAVNSSLELQCSNLHEQLRALTKKYAALHRDHETLKKLVLSGNARRLPNSSPISPPASKNSPIVRTSVARTPATNSRSQTPTHRNSQLQTPSSSKQSSSPSSLTTSRSCTPVQLNSRSPTSSPSVSSSTAGTPRVGQINGNFRAHAKPTHKSRSGKDIRSRAHTSCPARSRLGDRLNSLRSLCADRSEFLLFRLGSPLSTSPRVRMFI